jgi:hypothetical protein
MRSLSKSLASRFRFSYVNLLIRCARRYASLALFRHTSRLTTENIQIGPVYLKRLFFLHLGRTEALKRLLLSPPEAHDPVPQCSLLDQKTLTRAWSLATAYFAWDARPDTSVSTLNSSLTPLVDHLRCQMCRQNLQLRIRNLLFNWSQVKSTI